MNRSIVDGAMRFISITRRGGQRERRRENEHGDGGETGFHAELLEWNERRSAHNHGNRLSMRYTLGRRRQVFNADLLRKSRDCLCVFAITFRWWARDAGDGNREGESPAVR